MKNQNNITELRDILFDTLRGLKDKSIDIDHAKAISETAQVIINSAKVEADHARHTKRKTTAFMIDENFIEQSPDEDDTQEDDEASNINRTEPKLVSYSHRIGGSKEPIRSAHQPTRTTVYHGAHSDD